MYKQIPEPIEMAKPAEGTVFRKMITIMNESCSLRGLTESVARRLLAGGDKQIENIDEVIPEMFSLEEYIDQTLVELESLRKTLDVIIDALAQ